MKPKQYIVIGCGRFGHSVATTLCSLGHDVLVVDRDEDRIQNIAEKVTHAMVLDATDENSMKKIGIRNFDVAVISIGSDVQASILATLIAKEMEVEFVLCKAVNEMQGKVLYKIGADRVVYPERDMGERVAHYLVSQKVLDYIELDPHYSVVEILVPKSWVGKSMKQLDLRVKHGVNVVAIKQGIKINVSPMSDDVLRTGDILIVIGPNESLNLIDQRG